MRSQDASKKLASKINYQCELGLGTYIARQREKRGCRLIARAQCSIVLVCKIPGELPQENTMLQIERTCTERFNMLVGKHNVAEQICEENLNWSL
jgi:hypothetical protein